MGIITWQNINGPSLAEATRPMEVAQRSFENVFGGLGEVIKKREVTDAANWDQTKINNTNALLNASQEARTPEEFAAREAQLRQQLLGYGAQVDPAAVRAALDGRMATLQQRAVAGIDYQNKVTDNREAPIRDSIAALTSQGKFTEAKALLEQHALRNEAALYDANRLGERRVVTEGQADQKFGFDVAQEADRAKMAPLERASRRASTNASNASAGAANQQVLESQSRIEINRAQEDARVQTHAAALKQAAAQAHTKGTLYENGIFKGVDADIQALVSNNTGLNKGEQQNLLEKLAKLGAEGMLVDGKTIIPPKDLIKSLVIGTNTSQGSGEAWTWNMGGVQKFEAALKEAMNRYDFKRDAAGNQVLDANGKPDTVSPILDGYQKFKESLRIAAENPIEANLKGGAGGPKPPGEYKPPKPKK